MAIPQNAKNAAGSQPAAQSKSNTAARRVTVPRNVVGRASIDKPIPDSPAGYQPLIGRIPIVRLAPQQPDDLWPAKAFVGEVVPFFASTSMTPAGSAWLRVSHSRQACGSGTTSSPHSPLIRYF